MIGREFTTETGSSVVLGAIDAERLRFLDVATGEPWLDVSQARFQEGLEHARSTGRMPAGQDDQAHLLRQLISSIPGVEADQSRASHRAGAAPIDSEADETLGFSAFLERSYTGRTRVEQNKLRSRLIGGATTLPCILCGAEYLVQFLWASHIKKRSVCSDQEKNDPRVAMLACVFGCDALYESGFISVDQGGQIVAYTEGTSGGVLQRVSELQGRTVPVFEGAEHYFDWHHSNMFRGRDASTG